MQFDPPLIPARLRRRYKRFLADMVLADGTEVVAHCPNPGAMTGLAEPGSRCWLSSKTAKARKLDFGWEIVEAGGVMVGINTGHANRIVAEALGAGRIAGLPQGGLWKREIAFGPGTRFDFAHFAGDGGAGHGAVGVGLPTYLEVKSVTLVRSADLAEFPDARTERGARHLRELAAARALGHRAILLFLVQRGDCDAFGIAADIDPDYAALLPLAAAAGVEIRAHRCSVTAGGIDLTGPIPMLS